MHRYLFHWQSDWKPARMLVFVMHGNHHDVPDDRLRNLMPPIVSLPIAGLVWGFCVELIGAAGTWLFLGYITGYVAYDVTHYACHQWPMRGRLGCMLKRHHMRHHFIEEHRNYAITVIFWDRVFGSRVGSLRQ
ncbi:MAG: sterol desaturase family protein [Novosphingobium sp.]